MDILVTGAHGTVGTALTTALTAAGHRVVAWDRATAPPEDPAAPARVLAAVRPAALYHLAIASRGTGLANEGWVVNVEWSERLAAAAAAAGVRFVFASTVMVFSDQAAGPFTIDSRPDAEQGYGHEKRIAEERVRAACPAASIVRLGWQIGTQPGSNNMIDWLAREQAAHGRVRASRRWLPACAFLPDTAEALVRLLDLPPGLYHADANPDWNHYEIAGALSALHGGRWQIEPHDDFVYDQRMRDARLKVRSIAQRLVRPRH